MDIIGVIYTWEHALKEPNDDRRSAARDDHALQRTSERAQSLATLLADKVRVSFADLQQTYGHH